MYELPRTGDPIDDALLPFVLLYSAETVGLPPVRLPGAAEPSEFGYTPISFLVPVLGDETACLVPTFPCLVASEMHVLLRHANYLSPVWGQHVSQLSELLRSRSCEGGYDGLPELVSQEHSEFAEWMKCHLQGAANGESLARMKEAKTDESMLRGWSLATGMARNDGGQRLV
jgi:hypothetical protein